MTIERPADWRVRARTLLNVDQDDVRVNETQSQTLGNYPAAIGRPARRGEKHVGLANQHFGRRDLSGSWNSSVATARRSSIWIVQTIVPVARHAQDRRRALRA